MVRRDIVLGAAAAAVFLGLGYVEHGKRTAAETALDLRTEEYERQTDQHKLQLGAAKGGIERLMQQLDCAQDAMTTMAQRDLIGDTALYNWATLASKKLSEGIITGTGGATDYLSAIIGTTDYLRTNTPGHFDDLLINCGIKPPTRPVNDRELADFMNMYRE